MNFSSFKGVHPLYSILSESLVLPQRATENFPFKAFGPTVIKHIFIMQSMNNERSEWENWADKK